MATKNQIHSTSELQSSAFTRWLIENVWLLALPLLGIIFFTLAKLMNPLDLSALKYPRLIQLVLSLLLTLGLLSLPYRLFYPTFFKAKKEVELLYHAQAVQKEAKRFLRSSSRSSKNEEQMSHISELLQKLTLALKSKEHIQSSMDALEHALPKQNQNKASLKEYLGSFGIALLIALLVRAFLIGNYKIPSESMVPTLQIGDHLFVNQFIYGLRLPFTTWKIGTHIREPKRGEIIVFESVEGEDKDLIKRVIAIPGDVVDMRGDQLYINDKAIFHKDLYQTYHYFGFDERKEEWKPEEAQLYQEKNGDHTHHVLQVPNKLKGETYSVPFPYKVPPDHVFVMGDNRDNSHDGRYFRNPQGEFQAVPYGHIKGKAMFIWFSDGAKEGTDGKIQPWIRFERSFQSIE